MDVIDTEIPKPLSMTPDAVRSRARRVKTKARFRLKPEPKAKLRSKRPPESKLGTVARSERLDMRLTKVEKAKIIAKAKKTRRTVTSLVIEAIEKIK
jgi:hypothetical protein